MPIVKIDGVEVIVKEETTLLQAARKAKIWIPTLCYSPAVSNLAACRLCMVEIESGKDNWQLVTACNYPIRRDSVVRVNSEKAVRSRQGVMKLLLARSPESSELKQLAARMGVEKTPFPKVTESQRNCILCSLCISVCSEVIGCSAIGFAGRGVDKVVTTPFRLASEDCIACGACAAVCPVGTIQVRIHAEVSEAEISPFKSRVKLLRCAECGKTMVTEPVTKQMLNKVDFNWQEYRERVRLCPECKRKKTAIALGLIPIKSS
ncbi:MAG: 2Fe-2S iron-sulfur cluster-binding protein [Spirochaetota bacterium]